jgi:hypothetical protein
MRSTGMSVLRSMSGSIVHSTLSLRRVLRRMRDPILPPHDLIRSLFSSVAFMRQCTRPVAHSIDHASDLRRLQMRDSNSDCCISAAVAPCEPRVRSAARGLNALRVPGPVRLHTSGASTAARPLPERCGTYPQDPVDLLGFVHLATAGTRQNSHRNIRATGGSVRTEQPCAVARVLMRARRLLRASPCCLPRRRNCPASGDVQALFTSLTCSCRLVLH